MINQLLEIISDSYNLEEVDTSEYKDVELNGAPLTIKSFNAIGLGSVSLLSSTSNMMSLDTLVINPFEKDMHLFSYDCIKAFHTDTLLIELFDTLLDKTLNEVMNTKLNKIKEKYQSITNIKTKPSWYDSIRLDASIAKKMDLENSSILDTLTIEYLKEYLSLSKKLGPCDKELKMAKAKEYVDGLLNHGGASTGAFIQAKGKEFTEKLFREVLFKV